MAIPAFLGNAGQALRERLDRAIPARWQHAVRRTIAPLFGTSRTLAILFVVALLLSLLLIPSLYLMRSTEKEVAASRQREAEFNALAAEYVTFKKRVDSVEQAKTLASQAGLIRTMDDVLSVVGVKGKMKSAKDIGSSALDQQLREERAEFTIERLTLNELVNVLYKIDHAPATLSVKAFTVRKAFEDPRLLDVTLTVSLITSAPRK